MIWLIMLILGVAIGYYLAQVNKDRKDYKKWKTTKKKKPKETMIAETKKF